MDLATIASFIDSAITVAVGLYVTVRGTHLAAKIADPAERQKRTRLFAWCGPGVMIIGLFMAYAKFLNIEDPATREANAIRRTLPRMVDAITRIDRVKAEPGQRLILDSTVTTMNAAQISKPGWEAFMPKLRKQIQSTGLDRLHADGITVVYRYYGKDGGLIGELVLAPPARK